MRTARLDDPALLRLVGSQPERATGCAVTGALSVTLVNDRSEIERLSRLHAEQASRLKARPDLADKIVRSVGKGLDQVELATLTVVANVLLNLDETINKE